MGRRDDEDLPPIEVVGAEPSAGSMQRVSVGGRGAETRSRWPVVLGVGVLLAVLISVVTDDDAPVAVPAEETTTTTLPATTTTTARPTTTPAPITTTTTLPTGPVFPEPTNSSLLVYGNAQWTLVDLDTGERRPVPGLTAGEDFGIAVANGYVSIDARDARARYYPLAALLDDRLEPIDLGNGYQVLPSPGHPDEVWLTDGDRAFEGGVAGSVTMRLVDLTGRERRRITLPAGSYPEGAYDSGVLIQMGGRVFVRDEDSTVAIANARLLRADRDVLVLQRCDDGGRCHFEVRNLTAGTSTTIELPPSAAVDGFEFAAAPDGRFWIRYFGGEGGDGGDGWLRVYNRAGALVAAGPSELSPPWIWLPGSMGALAFDSARNPVWLRSDGAQEQLAGVQDLPIELFFLIEH